MQRAITAYASEAIASRKPSVAFDDWCPRLRPDGHQSGIDRGLGKAKVFPDVTMHSESA